MNKTVQLGLVLLAVTVLAGCSSKISTPWDKKELDPGQVSTMKPLEIPPDFSRLPVQESKKENSPGEPPAWIDPGQQEGAGGVPSMFKEPTLSETDSNSELPRSEKEELPSWMGPDVHIE
ncbi:MAG: hypothetical protein HQL70_09975 [Magnetococcales bacterium]|nr:hypothetical protein [Magnetococcales bacterium]